jgi:hypothetical protein
VPGSADRGFTTTLAGIPATVECGGTSLSTIQPAAIFNYSEYKCRKESFMTIESDTKVPGLGLHHIALTTTDIRAAIKQVRSAGYEINIEPKDVQL